MNYLIKLIILSFTSFGCTYRGSEAAGAPLGLVCILSGASSASWGASWFFVERERKNGLINSKF